MNKPDKKDILDPERVKIISDKIAAATNTEKIGDILTSFAVIIGVMEKSNKGCREELDRLLDNFLGWDQKKDLN